MKMRTVLKWMRFWPPYLGAGIRVTSIAEDLRSVDVEMNLRFWNRNYLGTHFGGSLYSMVDPFFVLMLIENLGRDYVVWDKAATIRFKQPGRGPVRAQFRLTDQELQFIRNETAHGKKSEPEFQVSIVDQSGAIIAEVHKRLYVRRKHKA